MNYSKTKAQPILHDVDGAPFRIGETVVVVQVTDDTVSSSFIGSVGKVVSLEYSCGCGQSFPFDPMIMVHFPNGRKEEFWREEIRRCSPTVCE
ncbi:MAG: hypothetical protein LLG03_16580 [Planctomycetaceae bacterium]|nr:hypothetical protein [Planctomycetaceae bacterium]